MPNILVFSKKVVPLHSENRNEASTIKFTLIVEQKRFPNKKHRGVEQW